MKRQLLETALALAVVALGALALVYGLDHLRAGEAIHWRRPLMAWTALGALAVGWAWVWRRRTGGPRLAFAQVALLREVVPSARLQLLWLPAALRMVVVGLCAVALARPQTFRTETKVLDSIDLIVVLDLSRSMEEADMRRNRLDAAQRVIRRFVRANRNDRIGLVVFAETAMLQTPLTHDMRMLEQVVADLALGDIPEWGTAIGDGLGLAVAQLRRSDAKSKVVVLLSDGESNVANHMIPTEAAQVAKTDGIRVYTILIGRELGALWGGGVDPATMKTIARTTGGQYFSATDARRFAGAFEEIRKTLDKTKRVIKRRLPDRELYHPLIIAAVLLLLLERALALTLVRRWT